MAKKIVKALAGIKDLFLGDRTVTQTRNGNQVVIEGISAKNLPIDGHNGETIAHKLSELESRIAALE